MGRAREPRQTLVSGPRHPNWLLGQRFPCRNSWRLPTAFFQSMFTATAFSSTVVRACDVWCKKQGADSIMLTDGEGARWTSFILHLHLLYVKMMFKQRIDSKPQTENKRKPERSVSHPKERRTERQREERVSKWGEESQERDRPLAFLMGTEASWVSFSLTCVQF